MHYPTSNIQTEFEINRLIKNQITATIKYFPHATDGRTDGQTSHTTTIGSNFREKKY